MARPHPAAKLLRAAGPAASAAGRDARRAVAAVAPPPASAAAPPADLKFKPGKDVLPYDKLKGMTLADGVDVARKEAYLSDAEFETVFKTGRAAFGGLPQWKQLRAKKEVGLF